jgi:hypothetical protein
MNNLSIDTENLINLSKILKFSVEGKQLTLLENYSSTLLEKKDG